ncbi:MAG: gfo/Idh/MocA family oxidoreductase [Candidatus Dadabacteria bacterium]|nr:MAG: gfo/Idh/MocA family oxidoreductase [Candidatus Dadabacteria bacterium]
MRGAPASSLRCHGSRGYERWWHDLGRCHGRRRPGAGPGACLWNRRPAFSRPEKIRSLAPPRGPVGDRPAGHHRRTPPGEVAPGCYRDCGLGASVRMAPALPRIGKQNCNPQNRLGGASQTQAVETLAPFTKNEPLRFGVIGCGAISTLYQLPALRTQKRRARLVAVADRDEAWARRVAKQYGAGLAVANYEDLLEAVDAVLIATPNASHREIACSCLDAGVHVLCEKPAAPTADDVRAMFEAEARSTARLMIAHCVRFSPHLQCAHGMHVRGLLGDDVRLEASLGGPYGASAHRTDFRRDPAQAGGGVLLDLGVHLIDLCVWFFGSSPELAAHELTAVDDWPVETDVRLTINFPGATAHLAASYSRQLANSIRISGTEGWIQGHLYQPDVLEFFSRNSTICRRDGAQQIRLDNRSMYELQFEHFFSALLEDRPFLIQADEVLATARTADACYRRDNANTVPAA